MATLVITPELEADALRLAAVTGETPTEAVAAAVRERLEIVQVPSAPKRKPSLKRLLAIIERAQSEPAIEPRLSEDEILGYNEHGMFD